MSQPLDAHSDDGRGDATPDQSPESFDRLIDEILDGDAASERLGQADAPGQSWRDLAMLRQTTELFNEDLEVPDQTHMILSVVHSKRGFATRGVLHRISSTRASIAAGLLVALGLYAFAEHMGLGTSLRGDVEPVTRLSDSTSRDAARVNTAIRDAIMEWTDSAETSTPSQTLAARQRQSQEPGRLELVHRDAIRIEPEHLAGRSTDADLRLRLTMMKQRASNPSPDQVGRRAISYNPDVRTSSVYLFTSPLAARDPRDPRDHGLQTAGFSSGLAGVLRGPFAEGNSFNQRTYHTTRHQVFGLMWTTPHESYPGHTSDFDPWAVDTRVQLKPAGQPILAPGRARDRVPSADPDFVPETSRFPSDLPR